MIVAIVLTVMSVVRVESIVMAMGMDMRNVEMEMNMKNFAQRMDMRNVEMKM